MSYILTNSKIHFSPQNPKNEDINIQDIAHALSFMCRANGHFNSFYSVAQHSINCALEAKAKGYAKEVQLACLLHDGSEAYMSDITRPVKKLLPEYLEMEEKLQKVIFEKFHIGGVDASAFKEIDDALLYHEFIQLLGERVFEEEPKLASHPDFSQRNFLEVKNEFLDLYNHLTSDKPMYKTVGIDGCKGGWMVAVLFGDKLSIERYPNITEAMKGHKIVDSILIDIPIGLADSVTEAEHRPDNAARRILKAKSSSLFPSPFRSVARAKTVSEAWEISKSRNAGTSYMTMGIRGAVNEVDEFLQENEEWKNVLCESHPEVCFTLLNEGAPVMEKKMEELGREKRLDILQKHGINRTKISEHPLFSKYSDDVIDAVCLALVGRFVAEGKSKTIPDLDKIMTDGTGLKMQMIIPMT